MARNCRFAVAVHVCAVLAMKEGKPATSEWIARSVNTNPVVVRRILSALGKAGLVTGQRGALGGSLLAKPAEAMSLLDIGQAVDEDEGPALHHQPPNAACPVGAHIQPVLSEVIGLAEAARERELAKVSLADVVFRIRSRSAAE